MQWTSDSSNTVPDIVQAQSNKPELRLGSNGEVVEELQKLLTRWGIYSGTIDGNFDKVTEASVKEYQRRVFLADDGVVAKQTWHALYMGMPVGLPELGKGCKGDLVMRLQRFLKSTQDYVGYVDGEFGELTESALQSWQRRHNLPNTGVVDESTWRALSRIPR
ncbi:peptidoglycan-binding protein [Chlorogloeopsis fritschii PCC 9212]|uniref:Peptidoglycan binding-like domain-containing protein n=1 Tax=Chlorogloeopsis fritschii PCC 6912 TaxID=211165 RepID=A0A433N6G7_CHLFR|nr:peptidoglycan-binding protein [Chlorogloeopsis fritschii]MBF2006735.1 peptidoglycan-binding protein [Chlorogloeopsis fritschii C42_A2020_084]RUR77088.1 hypothetical protein PCC6912_40470 [Chlorogloeopsis fritschii PCC 6912]